MKKNYKPNQYNRKVQNNNNNLWHIRTQQKMKNKQTLDHTISKQEANNRSDSKMHWSTKQKMHRLRRLYVKNDC